MRGSLGAPLFVVAWLAGCAAPEPPDTDGHDDEGPVDAGLPPADAGVLLEPSEPCTADAQCASSVCTDVFGPFGFTDYCSAECGSDADCAAFDPFHDTQCVDVGARQLCIRTCGASAQCRPGACLQELLFTGRGVCYFGEGRCGGDSDCRDGTSCLHVLTELDVTSVCYDDDAFFGPSSGESCDPNVPWLRTEWCGDDDDCGPGTCTQQGGAILLDDALCLAPEALSCDNWELCLADGLCAGPCDDDADCPTGRRCRLLPVTFAPLPGQNEPQVENVGVCTAWRGSGAACARDADCDGDELCAGWNSEGAWSGRCRLPESSDRDAGASCSDSPFTPSFEEPIAACASNVCFDGSCVGLCAADADCGAGARCRSFEGIGLCLAGSACVLDDDCAPDERCMADARVSPVLHRCVPSLGERAVGEPCDLEPEPFPCARDEHCFSSVEMCDQARDRCVPLRERQCRADCGAGLCTGACDVDADCGDPTAFACAGFRFAQIGTTAFDTGGAVVPRCIAAEGSRAACVLDEDCGAPERCQPFAERDGTPRGACLLPQLDAVLDGEICIASSGGVDRCASGVCDLNPYAPTLGTCAPLCETDADCAPDRSCLEIEASTIFMGVPRSAGPDGYRACGVAWSP